MRWKEDFSSFYFTFSATNIIHNATERIDFVQVVPYGRACDEALWPLKTAHCNPYSSISFVTTQEH
jgi:hypothetical protein